MMVESRNHRLLSFFSLSLCVSVCFFREGGQDAGAGAAAPPPRFFGDAFRSWVIPYGPLLRRLWLLLSPTLFDRRAMTLPPKARSTPRLSRSLLFYYRSGVGGRIWVYRPFLWVLIRYIGLGQRYSTNPHNQRLMEIKPISMAMMAAWVRSEAPNLLSIRPTWFLTVLVLRSNSLAICSLVRPLATSLKISASRGETFPLSGSSAAAGGIRRPWSERASEAGLTRSSCFSCFSWLRRNSSLVATSWSSGYALSSALCRASVIRSGSALFRDRKSTRLNSSH